MSNHVSNLITAIRAILESSEHLSVRDILKSEVLDRVALDQGIQRDQVAEVFELYEHKLDDIEFIDRWKVRYIPHSSTFRCERIPSTSQIERYVELNNRIVELELRNRLASMRGEAFERAIGEILKGCSWVESVSFTRVTGDGGIDINFTVHQGPLGAVKGIAQVKGWEQKVGVAAIREFIGVAHVSDPRPKVSLFISINGYTAEAQEVANAYKDIKLLQIEDILEWQRESQVGVYVAPLEMSVFDELSWSELENGEP